MLNKAIEKVKAEMETNKSNPYIQVVGEFLIQHISVSPSGAEGIIQEGKTIGKSLDEMKKVAEKKKVGNCAVLTDKEGFDIVLKYFGVNISGPTCSAFVSGNGAAVPDVQDKKTIQFNVELDF
jgi:hypothetical protein